MTRGPPRTTPLGGWSPQVPTTARDTKKRLSTAPRYPNQNQNPNQKTTAHRGLPERVGSSTYTRPPGVCSRGRTADPVWVCLFLPLPASRGHHNQQHIITTCKPCNTPQQDGSDSDSDYSDSSHNDEADHDEERAARKVHLLLSEIPTPAWQDIVMDRAAWNKMLRSIYTN